MNEERFSPQWSQMLQEAVSKPGLLLAAYNAFQILKAGRPEERREEN